MNSRDYARIAHAIRMARNETVVEVYNVGIDMVVEQLAAMLASDMVANRHFDPDAFLDACEYPRHEVPTVEWVPTHYSLSDGSTVRKVDDPGYGDGSNVMLVENECDDRFEVLAAEWAPID